MQLRHRVGELFLLRQPLEELPQGPVRVTGVCVTVKAQQPRWAPLQLDWETFIGGKPSQPNPRTPYPAADESHRRVPPDDAL